MMLEDAQLRLVTLQGQREDEGGGRMAGEGRWRRESIEGRWRVMEEGGLARE